jgi:hypothetical protein
MPRRSEPVRLEAQSSVAFLAVAVAPATEAAIGGAAGTAVVLATRGQEANSSTPRSIPVGRIDISRLAIDISDKSRE